MLDTSRKTYQRSKVFSLVTIIGGNKRLIGIPLRREILENRGAEFIFNTNFKEIVPDLILSGEIPRETPFEKGDKNQVLKTKEGYIKDPIWMIKHYSLVLRKVLLLSWDVLMQA